MMESIHLREESPAALSGREEGAAAGGPEASGSPLEGREGQGSRGLPLQRRYTRPGVHPFEEVEWERRRSVITDEKGRIIFEANDCEVPRSWSQLATDIVVSKYFRKAGVPPTGRETSVRQVIQRIVHTIRQAGEEMGGYFDSEEEADIFEAELTHLLVTQKGAFNSPVWFNCGLYHAYGIGGSGGNWAWDAASQTLVETPDSYSRPQCAACFIQSVEDDLMSIFNLVKNEARVFKFGSGTGTNFSKLRGRQEKLSGGGTSSGLMSFLEVFDRAAGATKSGGTTRRAAKMVIVDMDHPEIVDFIEWKVREEKKVAALVAAGYSADFNGEAYRTVSGQNSNNSVRVTDEFMQAALNGGKWRTFLRTTGEVCDEYQASELLDRICQAAWSCADPGIQYDTTINEWNTCANTDRIRASNPCCVPGDTLIAVADGRNAVPIKDLVGQEVPVYAWSHVENRVVISRMWNIGIKRRQVPVYRVTLDDGSWFRATGDHLILLRDGSYCQVKDLQAGDPLIPFHSQICQRKNWRTARRFVYDGQSWRAVERWQDEAQHQRASETAKQWMAEARAEGRPIGRPANERYQRCCPVCRQNFFPVREQQIFCSAACRYSPLGLEMTGAKSGQARCGRSLPPEHRKKISIALKATGRPEDKRRAQEQATRNTCLKAARALLDAGIEVQIERWEDLRETIRQLGIPHVPHSETVQRFFPSNEELVEHAALYNHKVVSVEFDGLEDVYDGTVDEHHNFGIITRQTPSPVAAGAADYSGIFIHNSEFMFLDDSACNLASLNLMKFLGQDGTFDVEGFRHACRVFILAQEILVDLSSYPTPAIARNSHDYRPLGLGYANLGTLLMVLGIPYDSDQGRAIAGALTAIMCGHAYATSAEIAARVGPFPRYAQNASSMLRVIHKHRDAAYRLDPQHCPEYLLRAAQEDWDRALELGQRYGYRNAQTTVIAPTGTIGLLMDCDTTGVEPDFALVKFKKLAGGGNFKIVNQSVPLALQRLGYTPSQIEEILTYLTGTQTLVGAPHINRDTLRQKGLREEELDRVEAGLGSAFDLSLAFNVGTVGEAACQRLGIPPARYQAPDFNLLRELGFSDSQIEEANEVICGRMTLEGAPHLREEHLAVFDCANRCGPHGRRFIAPLGHVRMMAAVQPFISGSISKCVSGDTLIATEKGLLPIRKFYAGEEPDTLRALDIEVASIQGPQRATAYYYGGKQPVLRLSLANGRSLTGTPNHRVKVATREGYGWKRLDQICPGDYVAFKLGYEQWAKEDADLTGFHPTPPYGSQKEIRWPTRMTPDLAYLLGCYTAEGNMIPSNWTLRLTNNDDGVRARCSELFWQLFGVAAKEEVDPRNGVKSLVIASKTLCEFFEYAGCGPKAAVKQIPWSVLESTRECVLEFIRGLWLDGYVTQKQGTVAITLSSRRLLEQLQVVFDNLGLWSQLGKRYNKEYDRDYYCLSLQGESAQGFARLFELPEAHKAEALQHALERERKLESRWSDVVPCYRETMQQAVQASHQTYAWRNLFDSRTQNPSWHTVAKFFETYPLPELREIVENNLHFAEVLNIEEGEEEVYDFHVPGEHAFLGNSIINHNTVNLPNEATVEDVRQLYVEGWRMGLKCLSLYRDGCKLSQPLSTSARPKEAAAEKEKTAEAEAAVPKRRRLPDERASLTHKFSIAGHEGYITVGLYPDTKQPGEIFITMSKQGSTIAGLMDSFATAISLALQYGVPLEVLVNKFSHMRFEPAGWTNNPQIRMAKSIMDYIFRWLALKFLPDREEPPAAEDLNGQYFAPLLDEEKVSRREAAVFLRQSDAPSCHECGALMVRNGTCYRCLNCGATSGCS